MSLYRITPDRFEPVPATTFAAERVLERRDLQRLLRENIEVIDKDLLVIAEEFGNWQDSTRRIDLLCLSRDASLVVVEIKRTEDGGHMDLQAIRYAAMVSSMTLDQVVDAYAQTKGGDTDAARREITSFLLSDNRDAVELTGAVQIVLVSSDFSVEVTTSVLWLNRQGLDLRCIRLRPYRSGSEVLVDVSQIIPLPEAAAYEVKLREQEREKRKVTGEKGERLKRFWSLFIERSKAKTDKWARRSPTDRYALSGSRLARTGFELNPVVKGDEVRAECYIQIPEGGEVTNKAFHLLLQEKDAIEKAFGGRLDWQELPDNDNSCRICTTIPGGWKSAESDWPETLDALIDALLRLETALKDPIMRLIL